MSKRILHNVLMTYTQELPKVFFARKRLTWRLASSTTGPAKVHSNLPTCKEVDGNIQVQLWHGSFSGATTTERRLTCHTSAQAASVPVCQYYQHATPVNPTVCQHVYIQNATPVNPTVCQHSCHTGNSHSVPACILPKCHTGKSHSVPAFMPHR